MSIGHAAARVSFSIAIVMSLLSVLTISPLRQPVPYVLFFLMALPYVAIEFSAGAEEAAQESTAEQ